MQNIKNDLFEFSTDNDGIATFVINQVNNPTNLFSTEFINEYLKIAHEAIADESIKGVILTSGRSMFMPGADLRELKNMGNDPEEQFAGILKMHQSFRKIETGGKPFVAAINGTAMGGGFELCLTCHYRIVLK
jgi:3-hydroxyacyl-CoA dehydrogenase/enoyl-CoA hydratase/3-hydroxybutyryl-CoA epimerase